MTMKQMQARLELLEQEVFELRKRLDGPIHGPNHIPGFGEGGAFADDPDFADVVRIGKEYRDKVNRESLVELDAELAAEAVRAKSAKKPLKNGRKKHVRA